MKYRLLIIFILASLISYSQTNELKISIDERIETLYIVASLNDYFLVSNHDSEYKHLLKKDLKELKSHKAVQLFDTLSKKYHFTFFRPVEWTLQFSSFPEFKKIKSRADNSGLTYPKEKEYLLKKFRKELILFHQDSLVQKYLREVTPLNKKVISQVKSSSSINQLTSYLEEYYGKNFGSYHLIISPLLHSGGFNAEMINDKGEKEIYALIGPNGEIDFIPYFDKDYLEMDLIIHEFGHSFVNPLIEKYNDEVESLKTKYFTEKLKKDAKSQGYSEWKYVFNELLLRATTIRIAEQNFGKEKAEKLLNYEKSVGFSLVENIVEILKEYDLNRDKYDVFDKFYPTLIERMK